MSHLTIYVKRSKGQLQYRDSEGNTGDTITSHAKHDEKIIWKLDKCSGISEITGIQLKGDLSILNGTPRKVDFNQWEVYTSGKAEGELTYAIEFEGSTTQCGWPPFNPPPRTHGVNIHLNLQLCGGSFLLSDYFFLVCPLMPAHVLWPTAVCISLTQIQSFLLSRNVICS